MKVVGQSCIKVRVNVSDLAYLHSTIEAYEGLATLTTVDGGNGYARIIYFSHFTDDVIGLLRALEKTIDLRYWLEHEKAHPSKSNERDMPHA
jgi:hypothetical protein